MSILFKKNEKDLLFTIEKTRLEDLFQKFLIYNNGSVILDEVCVEIDEETMRVNDVSKDSIAVVGDFSKYYFVEWGVNEKKTIIFHDIHRKNIKKLRGREVSVFHDGDNLLFKTSTDTYKIETFTPQNCEGKKLPINFPSNVDPKFKIKVDGSEIHKLHDIGRKWYYFIFKNGEWKARVGDANVEYQEIGAYRDMGGEKFGGALTRTIPIKEGEIPESLLFRISKKYFDVVAYNLKEFDDVWVEANQDLMLLHAKDETFTLRYVIVGHQ